MILRTWSGSYINTRDCSGRWVWWRWALGWLRASYTVKLLCAMVIFMLLSAFSAVFAADVTLAWDQVTNAKTYKLHCGPTTGGPYGTPVDTGLVLQHKLTGIASGIDTFCVATAHDASGVSSAFSNEVKLHPALAAPVLRVVIVISGRRGELVATLNGEPVVNLTWRDPD